MNHFVRAALLDIDGTLVDSNDAHAHAWVAAFALHGVPVGFNQVRAAIGKGGDKLLPDLTGIPEESRLGQASSKARKSIFKRDHLPTLKPFPGAADFVARLGQDGLRIAIATSAAAAEVGALLEIAGATHLYKMAMSADDVDRSKPDPDVVGACLARLGATHTEALLLGDTPYDVLAARRAGVAVVGVESGGWSSAALDGAITVYRNVRHLLDDFEASPYVTGLGAGPQHDDIARVSSLPGERRNATAPNEEARHARSAAMRG